jgi:hypothetical protein
MSGTTSVSTSTSTVTSNNNVVSNNTTTSNNNTSVVSNSTNSNNSSIITRSVNGNDFIDASGTTGNTLLQGGGGSNFIIAGMGNNTVTLDFRNAATDTFSTIEGLHAGDNVFLFGVDPSTFNVATANDVLPAAPGLDFAFTATGKPSANVNLPGYTTTDLANDKLSVGFGKTADLPNQPGVDYMFVHVG